MTEELQDAYNEWLLKFGYRVIDTDDMTSKDYFICHALHNYEPGDFLMRKTYTINGFLQITYQLKPPEEIITK